MTGLIWEVKTDDGSIHDKDNIYIWFDAQDVFIPALNSQNFGGYSDWRLPTVKEFSSLVESSILYPGPAINTVYFQTSGRLTTPTTGPLRWHQDPTSCPSISSVITYGTYYKRGNLAEAMEAYQNPLAIDPRHALTHNNLGLVYEKQGDFTQAISGYELAIKINLATMESRYNLGNLYESQEMSDKVISRYKELLLVDPS